MIHESGTFAKEIFNELGRKAYDNRKQILSKLRRNLKDQFGITNNPITWNVKTKMYETQFGARSELEG